jgi:CRISPR system Cascade subunit CasE
MKHLVRVPIPSAAGPYKAHQIVSETCNDKSLVWRRFSDHAIVLARNPVDGLPCKPYDPSPVNGQRLRFELLAEITKADGKPKPGEKRAARVDPVINDWIASKKQRRLKDIAFEQGAIWLQKRENVLGVTVSIDATDYEVMEFVRKGKAIRVAAINYQGILTVTDANKLKSAMLNGIGHGKAWGCGLLLCHRINKSQGDFAL